MADAKRSCIEQEAQESSSSSAEPKAIREPAEVLFDERPNIVDMLIGSFNIGEQQTRICQVDDVVIDGTKDVLVELVKSQMRNFFRAQDLTQDEHMTSEEAAMMVETGATQVLEVFSPKYFAARAGDLGLRPRFAVDLCGTKPYGPNDGRHWDLSSAADVKELHDVIDFEQTVLVSGSPPCTISSLQQRPADLKETGRLLQVSVRTYWKQQDAGRYSLHGNPSGCSSWDEVEIRKVQSEPGVFAIISPMCCNDA